MTRLLKPLGWFGMLGLILLLVPAVTHAATVTFVFDTCGTGGGTNQSCSGPVTFTSGGFSITATAFGSLATGAPASLYAKNLGGDEVGLGLNNNPGEDEIIAGSFIQLTLSSAIEGNNPLTIQMDSTTAGEEWEVCETNTPGSMAGCSVPSTALTFTDELGHLIFPTDTYLDFTSIDTSEAPNGNVLLHSLSFTTPTPEPSGLALLGTGILGVAGAIRRRLKV